MVEKAIIISAPSGAGKTTLVKLLLQRRRDLEFSISACTRAKREGEVDGRDYYFLSDRDFQRKIREAEFIEWEEVYQGMFYGTLFSELERVWSNNKAVIFDIDVQGAIHLKEKLGKKALSIFIAPPSVEVLEERLRSRGTESEESLERRLAKSMYEMQFQNRMDAVVVNDELETAFIDLNQRVEKFLADKV
ncbi:MAG: guanylate kinase [Bacteroidetes bacterium]|nr:guanylate kinase [Bacteroidota bacterium]